MALVNLLGMVSVSFSGLTLLVGRQERQLACKNVTMQLRFSLEKMEDENPELTLVIGKMVMSEDEVCVAS